MRYRPRPDRPRPRLRRVLDGQAVSLRRGGSADRDRYGRLLRYVEVPGVGDLGRYMVADGAHTGIYQGGGDASPPYVASLQDRSR